jgi:hypothetical protein
MNTAKKEFDALFWDAFHVPNLKTQAFTILFESLEPLNDVIVGPLFSIYENAHCHYVFHDKERFPQIHTKEDLFNWLNERIQQYKKMYDAFVIEQNDSTADFKHDQQLMHYQIDMKIKLCDYMMDIL